MAKRSLFWAALLLVGCGDFWGRKTDLSFIEVPQYDAALVAYVPLLPYWEGFEGPVDICVGYDDLIYVADSVAGLLVCLDQAGRRLASYALPGVHAVAQDRRLELLVAGPVDNLVGGGRGSVGARFFSVVGSAVGGWVGHAGGGRLGGGPLFFFCLCVLLSMVGWFCGIAVRGDNSYYVTRNGPDNDPLKFGGPDDAVLLFDSQDRWQEAIVVQTSTEVRTDFFQGAWGLVTPARPPQSPFVSQSPNFWVGLTAPGVALRVHAILRQEGEQGGFYTVSTAWQQGDTSLADGFLATPGRFLRPEGLALTGGAQPYLLVADAGRDSVYVFTLSGLEGVYPPTGSGLRRPVKVSFGGTGSGPLQMRRPTALAHARQILYVVDSGNRRVMRLRLTIDF